MALSASGASCNEGGDFSVLITAAAGVSTMKENKDDNLHQCFSRITAHMKAMGVGTCTCNVSHFFFFPFLLVVLLL